MLRSIRLTRFLHSPGLRDGVVMTGSVLLAGALDYLFNVFTGRLLSPVQYSILISVLAILQVLLHVTNVIRNVTAYYAADITTQFGSTLRVGPFLRQRHRWAWRWGFIATVTMILLSPTLARLLQINTPLPLWAASLALLMLFVRPVTDGTLQGTQQFSKLAAVTIFQAMLRLSFALLLIAWGWQAAGAVLALPLATTSAFLLAYWFLRPYFRAHPDQPAPCRISRRYSTLTFVGMLIYALLTNMDAVAVKILFPPEVASGYAPVVTLGKINLFIPLAIAMVFFPKAIQRHKSGQDARPLLLAALAAALLPGLGLTAVYFIAPGFIVDLIFGGAYPNPGSVLGLVGLATTLFSGLNIWLNYALSTERQAYIYALVLVLVVQVGDIIFFHKQLTAIPFAMIAAGLLGNLSGIYILLRRPAK